MLDFVSVIRALGGRHSRGSGNSSPSPTTVRAFVLYGKGAHVVLHFNRPPLPGTPSARAAAPTGGLTTDGNNVIVGNIQRSARLVLNGNRSSPRPCLTAPVGMHGCTGMSDLPDITTPETRSINHKILLNLPRGHSTPARLLVERR
jgi:hypothetical protein